MTELTLVNLTPHVLNIVTEDGSVLTLPKPETEARVAESWENLPSLSFEGYSISVSRKGLHKNVEGLPEPKDGTLFIVSTTVLKALPGRKDLLSPGTLIRDKDGKVIACQGLSAL